jgi:hypothetical protein
MMDDTKTFDDWASEHMVCTEFAAAYARENEGATIKFGEVDGNEHAWVYDAGTDKTLDATLSQWEGFVAGCERDDWWPGNDHPIATETDEFETVEAFAEGPGGACLMEGA